MRYKYDFELINGNGGIYHYSDVSTLSEQDFDINPEKYILIKIIDTKLKVTIFDPFLNIGMSD